MHRHCPKSRCTMLTTMSNECCPRACLPTQCTQNELPNTFETTIAAGCMLAGNLTTDRRRENHAPLRRPVWSVQPIPLKRLNCLGLPETNTFDLNKCSFEPTLFIYQDLACVSTCRRRNRYPQSDFVNRIYANS